MESTAMVEIKSAGNQVYCNMHISYFCLSQNQSCSFKSKCNWCWWKITT